MSSSSSSSSSSEDGNGATRGGDFEGPPLIRRRANNEIWPGPFVEDLVVQVAIDASRSGRLDAAAALANLFQERQVQVIQDIPAEVSSMYLYGDNLRLQQVLSDFLTNALIFTPAFEESSVTFRVIPRKERIGTKIHIVYLEFRITHPAPGIPEDLIQEMFHHSQGVSREGLGLYISQKLVKIMNGTVQYLREAERSSFIILVEFPLAHHLGHH